MLKNFKTNIKLMTDKQVNLCLMQQVSDTQKVVLSAHQSPKHNTMKVNEIKDKDKQNLYYSDTMLTEESEKRPIVGLGNPST